MVNSQPMPAHALSLGQFPTVISRNLNLSIIATGIMAFVGILTDGSRLTMTNVLLPVLMGLFTVSTATVQWLTTGYLLMVAVVISVSSYCNRRFTNRATFIIAMVLCIAALAAIAPTLHADSNAVFNTLQQLGGVVGTTVMALCLSIVQFGHGEVGSRDYMEATKQGGEWALIVVSVFVFVAILANLRAFLNDRRQHVRMR